MELIKMIRTQIPISIETRQQLKEYIVINRIKNYDEAIKYFIDKAKANKN